MVEEKSTTQKNESDAPQTEAPVKAVPKEKETVIKKVVKKTVKGRKKRKQIRQVSLGRAYIKATYNNTIITFTDQNGNTLAASSAGENGFRGPKKATPYAASIIVRKAVEKAQPYGLREVNVFVKGVGLGRESAIRAINANGINILSIKDITPIPHNGCRKRKPRRV
jgi:small subunit ribosomal protein S11